MKVLLLLILLGTAFFCNAQQTKTVDYYFNSNLDPSTKAGSVYIGKGMWDDSLYRLDLYDRKKLHLVSTAHYTDSTLDVRDGEFLSYYESGNVENIGFFKMGLAQGVWIKWNDNKKIADSVWYTNNMADSGVYYYYGLSKPNPDYLLRYNYHDSTITRIRYDDHGTPLPQDATDFSQFGRDTIVTNPDVEVAYPGEDSILQQYLQYKFNQDKYLLLTRGTSGFCSIRFQVDVNGQASHFTTVFCDNNSLSTAMTLALGQITWIPAMKDNKPVSALKEVSTEYYPSLTGVVQKKERKYFFDQNLNSSDREHARYRGKITADGNLVELLLQDIESGRRVFYMHFTDSTLETADGTFESYHYDGSKHVRGNFLLGRKNGTWITWNEKGQALDSSFYDIGALTSETELSYQPEGALERIRVTDYASKIIRSFYYNRGKCTSVTAQDSNGKYISYSDTSANDITTPPEFPGGNMAWIRYMNDYHEKNINKIHTDGSCVVRIRVDTSGNIVSVEPLTMKKTSLARFAVDALLSGPKWIPATRDGKKVEAYYLTVFSIIFITMYRRM